MKWMSGVGLILAVAWAAAQTGGPRVLLESAQKALAGGDYAHASADAARAAELFHGARDPAGEALARNVVRPVEPADS